MTSYMVSERDKRGVITKAANSRCAREISFRISVGQCRESVDVGPNLKLPPLPPRMASYSIDNGRVMPQPVVPNEIWSQILRYVPRIHQTKLLEVSHLFHDIALDLVFSAVKIYFLEGEQAYNFLNTSHGDFVEMYAEDLVTRSYEILRRIIRDPAFAQVVKSVTVIAFSDSTSIFEQREFSNRLIRDYSWILSAVTIADALAALPHLRSFRWCGVHPRLTDAVARHIPNTIQSMNLQT
jgi:hypothetical protein